VCTSRRTEYPFFGSCFRVMFGGATQCIVGSSFSIVSQTGLHAISAGVAGLDTKTMCRTIGNENWSLGWIILVEQARNQRDRW
jgi:hypothetical protein